MTSIPHSEKYARLGGILSRHGKLAVAYSGGVDSVFLLKAACETLGPAGVLAVTVRAANFPAGELRDAEEYAKRMAVRHIVADCDVFGIPGFAENPPDRCYFCKKELFGQAAAAARANGFPVLADGANVDDLGDYRPGTRAARELGVVSPLQDAGLAKSEIRALLRHFGMPVHAKPAYACLASRIPYGTRIERETLERIERAEDFFHRNGFSQVRVRVHGDVARIELEPDDRDGFARADLWEKTAEEMREIGFAHAALDLSGYRRGGLNDAVLS